MLNRSQTKPSFWMARCTSQLFLNLVHTSLYREGLKRGLYYNPDVETLLVQCWASVADGGPALGQVLQSFRATSIKQAVFQSPVQGGLLQVRLKNDVRAHLTMAGVNQWLACTDRATHFISLWSVAHVVAHIVITMGPPCLSFTFSRLPLKS